MLKVYFINNDNLFEYLEEHSKIINGLNDLIELNDFFEIWKVLLPNQIKLICFIKKRNNKVLVIESETSINTKEAKELFIIQFNTALKGEKIDFLHIYNKYNN